MRKRVVEREGSERRLGMRGCKEEGREGVSGVDVLEEFAVSVLIV